MPSKMAHGVYDMKYHIVLVTKYRKPVITGDIETMIKEKIVDLIEGRYEGQVIQMESDKDHIHILASLCPKYSRKLPQFGH